jgi:uncharacterized membrane protein
VTPGPAPQEGAPPGPDRAPRPIHHHLLLAHHRRAELDRCLLLPTPIGRIALCARCLGLYTTLLGALALQLALGAGPRRVVDWAVVLVGIFPALFDWGASFAGSWRGTNAIRLVTGALLGVALGRSIILYFIDARCELFWVQAGLLGAGVLAFALLRRIQPLF